MENYNNIFRICTTCNEKYPIFNFMKIVDNETNICDECVKCNKDKSVKICRKCDTVKLLKEFQPNNKTNNGLSSWCRPCYLEYKKKYNLENKEKLLEKRKVWNETRAKEYNKKYYENHKEYFNKYYKNYNAAKKLEKKKQSTINDNENENENDIV